MKVRHFFAVCLAGMVWIGNAQTSLLACEACDNSHVCNACCQADDRGLLERIDSALIRRQPHLPRVCLPQLPSLRDAFRHGLLGSCGCGAGPSCGCEITPASCGCEITPASCGCEITPAGCGCEITPASCGVEFSGVAGQATTRWQPNPETFSQPDIPSPNIASSDDFRPRQQPIQRPSVAPRALPLPQHSPAEAIPTPDSENDPFRDDSVRVLRRVPAQSIQLRPSGRAYRQSYDPQARHESVRMSLGDQKLPVQLPSETRLSQVPRTGLDANGSSRQGNYASAAQPGRQRVLPAVVTASALANADYESSSSPSARPSSTGGSWGQAAADANGDERHAAQESVTEGSPVAGFNPLRSSRHR